MAATSRTAGATRSNPVRSTVRRRERSGGRAVFASTRPSVAVACSRITDFLTSRGVLRLELVPPLGHRCQRVFRADLAGGGLDVLPPEVLVPDPVPLRIPLRPGKLELLLPDIQVHPLRERLFDLRVIKQRFLTKAESRLERPALRHNVFAIGLSGEVLDELAAAIDDAVAAVDRHLG